MAATPRTNWTLPLLLIAGSVASHQYELDALLSYQRDAVLGGEQWRLLTAHLAHLNLTHLLTNLAGLLLIWELWGARMGTLHGMAATAATAAGTGLGLLWISTDVAWYVGLSGVLHGLLAAGATLALLERPGFNLLVLAGLAVKLGWELGQVPLVAAPGLSVIAEAHVFGAVAGLGYALLVLLLRQTVNLLMLPKR